MASGLPMKIGSVRPFSLGLLQEEDRGIRLQVHPHGTEQHSDHA